MKIAMILPIYNESKTIDAMLSRLDALPGDWEILFADGGSTDDTVEKIGSRHRVLACPKGRANQMNFAAQAAAADVLWFVHCDSQLPTDAHAQISHAVARGAQWGCFHIGFDYRGPFMGCNTFFSNRRAKRGIAFGDQENDVEMIRCAGIGYGMKHGAKKLKEASDVLIDSAKNQLKEIVMA